VLVLFWIGAAIILKSCFGRHFEKGFHHPHFKNSALNFWMKTAILPLHGLIMAEFVILVENSQMKAAKSSPTCAWF